MQPGYSIFQVDLRKPNFPYDWTCAPIAWCLFARDAEHLCEYLNDRIKGLYYFNTRKA